MMASRRIKWELRAARIGQLRDLVRQRLTPQGAEQALQRLLRDEMAALPPIVSDGRASTDEWNGNRRDLRDLVAKRDVRYFLSWPVLQATMVVPSDAPYVLHHELPAVRDAGWLPLITEDLVGAPALIPGTMTSGNLVHHAYHLIKFEQATGVPVASHGRVTEFGGGYGSMARLLYRLSVGRLVADIVDVPEFACLQRHFLRSVGVPETGMGEHPGEGHLLLATWSLSEVPADVRSQFLEEAGPFDSYLIGYQSRFGEVDNIDLFHSLVETTPGVDWIQAPIEHLPTNYYLFGTRSRRAV